jgi:hypothetical protein
VENISGRICAAVCFLALANRSIKLYLFVDRWQTDSELTKVLDNTTTHCSFLRLQIKRDENIRRNRCLTLFIIENLRTYKVGRSGMHIVGCHVENSGAGSKSNVKSTQKI